MWSDDPIQQAECTTLIQAVYNNTNLATRYTKALESIQVLSATFKGTDDKFRRWAGTMALAAMDPDTFKYEEEYNPV
jgi:3D (Asp-Asp-Asp) domain-containing protein